MVTATKDVISILNDLIKICKDGELGFQAAGEETKNEELRILCAHYAMQRSRFAGDLKQTVRQLGGDPEIKGSVAADLHRGWMDVKSAVTGNDFAALVAECERGEDVAKAAYEDALKSYIPAEISELIQRQYREVREAHDRFRAMKKATA